MDQVQALWAPRAAQDGVTLMVGYEGDTELAGVLDGPRLTQVFNNLIGHALKFARNGMVEASLKAHVIGDRIRLEARVRDDGPGGGRLQHRPELPQPVPPHLRRRGLRRRHLQPPAQHRAGEGRHSAVHQK